MEQEHDRDVIRIFYYAQVQQHQGWVSRLGTRLFKACRNRGRNWPERLHTCGKFTWRQGQGGLKKRSQAHGNGGGNWRSPTCGEFTWRQGQGGSQKQFHRCHRRQNKCMLRGFNRCFKRGITRHVRFNSKTRWASRRDAPLGTTPRGVRRVKRGGFVI